jgi:hypothetical protein
MLSDKQSRYKQNQAFVEAVARVIEMPSIELQNQNWSVKEDVDQDDRILGFVITLENGQIAFVAASEVQHVLDANENLER